LNKTTRIDFHTIDAICKALDIEVGALLEIVEEAEQALNGPLAKMIKKTRGG